MGIRKLNVVAIHDAPGDWAAVNERKMIVREHLRTEMDMNAPSQAVGCVLVMVDESGNIRTQAVNIEPEHVPRVCDSFKRLTTRLRSAAKRARQGKTSAAVIGFTKPTQT